MVGFNVTGERGLGILWAEEAGHGLELLQQAFEHEFFDGGGVGGAEDGFVGLFEVVQFFHGV